MKQPLHYGESSGAAAAFFCSQIMFIYYSKKRFFEQVPMLQMREKWLNSAKNMAFWTKTVWKTTGSLQKKSI